MPILTGLLPLGALLLSLGTAEPRELEAGARALDGCWYTSGGCAARTGVTPTRAIERDPSQVWRYEVRGKIESEPLVWGSQVIVAAAEGPGRRSLHVLGLDQGDARVYHPLRATTPLSPSVWEDALAIRPAVNRIEILRIAGSRLLPYRTIQSPTSLSAALLFEDQIYLREGDELVRYDLRHKEPSWRTRVAGRFRGTPSVRGDYVFAVYYDDSGYARLARVDRSDGSIAEDVVAGHHQGQVPVENAPLSIRVLESEAFVHYPLPIVGTSGSDHYFAAVPMHGLRFYRGRGASVHSYGTQPTAWNGGWIALEQSSDAQPRWIASRNEGRTITSLVLATPESHAYLLEPPVAPTVGGDLVYLNRLAVSTDDFEVQWRGAGASLFSPVPARNNLLVVDQPNRLIALREKERRLGRSEIAALEIAHQLENRLAESYARLAADSIATGDLDLTRRLIGEATRREARGRSLEAARQGLARLEAQSRAPRIDDAKVRRIENAEQELAALPMRKLTDQARETSDRALKIAILDTILQRDPTSLEASHMVRELLPADAPVRSPFDASSWLEFLRAQARAPVSFVSMPGKKPAKGAHEEHTLFEESRHWRGDLSGYRSDRLFIVTPPGRPGPVARSLSMGELVCDTLEEIFEPLGSAASNSREREALTLYLYETQEEYIQQSQRDRSLPEVARGWTAGHYSPSENLSRMFVPATDDISFRLLDVYAHELTHHWLAARGPFQRGQRSGSVRLPGYWIAEGFATMVEEFDLDPEAQTWSADNPRAPSLDAVANAKADQLIPWEKLFRLSKEEFLELSGEADRAVALSWRLGVHAERSEIQFFYAQAGAVCHYLFQAEGGRYRRPLLEYVRAWYEGEPGLLDFETTFAIRPELLGARVAEFARKASGG